MIIDPKTIRCRCCGADVDAAESLACYGDTEWDCIDYNSSRDKILRCRENTLKHLREVEVERDEAQANGERDRRMRSNACAAVVIAQEHMVALEAARDEARAEAGASRAALLKYGDHLPLSHFAGSECTCGFDAALKADAGREFLNAARNVVRVWDSMTWCPDPPSSMVSAIDALRTWVGDGK